MSTTVTLQLNAIDVAGDWATRSAGNARTGTGRLGSGVRRDGTQGVTDETIVLVSQLRGAVEAIRRGAHSPNIAESRSDVAEIGWGTPALYCGMRFAFAV